jgi:hypothetical protein
MKQDADSRRASLVLDAVLRLLRPAARLLLRHGVSYRSFSVACKRVFLDAAQDELKARGMSATDSAITLLSGVHRRDVRNLLRDSPHHALGLQKPASLASEVVGRWLQDKRYRKRNGELRALPRGNAEDSFDALVHSVSQDIRARAMLDELLRLGVAREIGNQVELVAESFVPREGFAEVAALIADNVHDHLAAAAENLHEQRGHLEQSIFVDEITGASIADLHRVSVQAWKQAFQLVMSQAQESFAHDAAHAPAAQRNQRARFGVYFYSTPMDTADDASPELAANPGHATDIKGNP